jgi:D-alanyl-D-alanine carboxypeptidase
MRSSCVGMPRVAPAARALVSLVLALLVTIALAVPEAEARRRRHAPAGGGYTPPYASIVYDVNSGRVLQATNADAHRHPASVTKVMTLYMLFEQLETGRFQLDSELPVSREAASQAPSKLGLRPGETISVEDAIKALVTKSANDIAVVVAEAIGGDEERFAAMMTKKARAIGMSRTVFRNASGLPNTGQVTTARDLVTLGRAIQDRFPKYYPYFGTRVFTYDGRGHRNHNRLLGRVEGVDGIKTGYTHASGFNLLTSAKADGRHLITVVLGGRSARIRDQQVASLIENHMDSAYAGRRMTARTVDVASRDAADDEEEDGGTTTKPATPPATALPQPPNRPRTAVIAETGLRPQNEEQSLTRGRRLALAASGSTNIVQSATTPLALVGTTPRSPAMRWVPGPQAADAAPPGRGEGRIVPPGSVHYTNALPAEAVKPEEAQPLPAPSTKVEERLPALSRRVELAAPPAPEAAKRVAAAEPVKETGSIRPAPARSGWIIQLAATDTDAKARAILDSAVEKTGRLLRQNEPFTEAVTKSNATFYRARFGGFEGENAQEACKALKRAGFNCIAQKL